MYKASHYAAALSAVVLAFGRDVSELITSFGADAAAFLGHLYHLEEWGLIVLVPVLAPFVGFFAHHKHRGLHKLVRLIYEEPDEDTQYIVDHLNRAHHYVLVLSTGAALFRNLAEPMLWTLACVPDMSMVARLFVYVSRSTET